MTIKVVTMLSKSRFLAGLECPLRLWHRCFNPDLAGEWTLDERNRFDTGHAVGILATHLYPGGVFIDIDHLTHPEAINSTHALMSDAMVPAIFEAVFIYDDIRVRADILERVKGGRWNLIEVKSSTTVKDFHLTDVAIQYHVLQGAGLKIDRAGILHLNNRYIYNRDNLDVQELFQLSDMTEDVIKVQETIPAQVNQLKEMLARIDPPSISPSRHCKKPFTCEFWEHCTAKMPKFWIMGLSGISEQKLDALSKIGIIDICDIPESFPLSALQHRIRACVVSKQDYFIPALREELLDVEYPIHFLDFETVGPAITRYPGTSPYQTIPF